MINLLKIIYNHQQENPDNYIGGSISLMLQNIIPIREIKDIDVISLNKKYKRTERIQYIDNYKFEFFFNPKAEYIYYQFEDKAIKLSPAYEVIDWKCRFKNMYPNSNKLQKHLTDIECYNKWLNND